MIRDSLARNNQKTQDSTPNLVSNPQPKEILVVASGGGISLVGSIIERGLGYIYSAVLVWWLGAESFGLFTLAMAISTLVGMIANLGLAQGVVRYGAIESQIRGRGGVHGVTVAALKIAVPASFFVMSVMLWSASSLANVFNKPELSPLLKAMAISIPFMSVQFIFLASTRALKVMKYSVIVGVFQPLIALVSAGLLFAAGYGILAISFAYSVSYMLGACLAAFYYLRLTLHKNKLKSKFAFAEMVRFSLPLSLIQWINYTNQRTEVFFLGLLPTTIDVGIYNIALRLAGLETIFIDSLNQIFGPFTSELSHQRQIEKLENLYKTVAKWAFTGGLVLFLTYMLFATTIMKLFDISFVQGTSVLIALGFAQLINAVTGPCGTVLLMSGRSGLSLMNTLILLGTSILLDWFLIPRYGLVGATLAGASTIILVNILRVIEVWATLRIHPFRWDFIKPLAAGISSFAVVYLLRFVVANDSLLMNLVYVTSFVLCFITFIILLKLNQEDTMILKAIRQKITGSASRQSSAIQNPNK